MASGTNSKSRLTDVFKWDQTWFTELSQEHKLLWIYMNDKCDNIGVYTFNKRRIEFDTHVNIDVKDIADTFNQHGTKIQPIENNHLEKDSFLLVDFCKYQHCKKSALLPTSNVFVSYMRDIKNAGLVDYFYQNIPDVVSEDTFLFFKAFDDQVLDFQVYSNKRNKDKSRETPFILALEKIRKHYSSTKTNGMGMASSWQQGKGIGKGIGFEKGVDKGTDTGNGTTSYQASKDIADRLTVNESGSMHETVKQVKAIADYLIECGTSEPYQYIERIISDLEMYYTKSEITIELIKERTGYHKSLAS